MPFDLRPLCAAFLLGSLAAAVPASANRASAPCAAPGRDGAARADPWWKHAVIYEVYPRSFADTDRDGVGDLDGIAAHLDHLKALGVTAIWLTPVYPSPQADFGYDISDYEAVDPRYGTMADLMRLQSEANARGMCLILDMVLNHTSDRHRWFQESASSRTNARADWYVWTDGIAAETPGIAAVQKREEHGDRVPPNNWRSVFGGSAWEWVPARRQFYYHRFYKEQPDLNWRNPAVEQAMFTTLRFWLDRGISGFRLDVIASLFEDPQFRPARETGGTNPIGEPNLSSEYVNDLPEVHGVLRRMRALVDSYPDDRVLIGETYPRDTAALAGWYGTPSAPELHLAMNTLLGFPKPPYTTTHFRPLLTEAAALARAQWPLFVFDNHDFARSIDRFGDGAHDIAIAKGIATILFGSQATAMTYYGAEIGMRTETPRRKEDVRDPVGIRFWPIEKGRDGGRTPMQWTSGANAGFSTATTTWLPIPASAATITVAAQRRAPDSLLNWDRTLIRLRARNAALARGDMTMIDTGNPDVLAWCRRAGKAKAIVAVNMTDHPAALALGESGGTRFRTLAASAAGTTIAPATRRATIPPFTSWLAAVE